MPQDDRPPGPAMEPLLPPGTAVVEVFGDVPGATLFPQEAAALTGAVEQRRREYATVRHCAREALARLGHPPVAIPNGRHREPLWPPGILGSMTHCDGYRVAALTREGTVASLGIDAEPHEPVPDRILTRVARPEERLALAAWAADRPDICWDRLLFSAKESVYKAWFPLARRWLDHEDATVRLAPDGTFTAALHRTGPPVGGTPLTAMNGRWCVRNGLILTAVVV
ncbi:4'-phosphopantetheinyl transferase [Streptomyces sp. NPDC059783]|uniref:4'-phosphopantetheinyl transferase family protein n=1 Tax=Streptomyces sp. NPDC059783 TaxID=3346944 RepID=UPI0036608978